MNTTTPKFSKDICIFRSIDDEDERGVVSDFMVLDDNVVSIHEMRWLAQKPDPLL
jgi:hypothetical protein